MVRFKVTNHSFQISVYPPRSLPESMAPSGIHPNSIWSSKPQPETIHQWLSSRQQTNLGRTQGKRNAQFRGHRVGGCRAFFERCAHLLLILHSVLIELMFWISEILFAHDEHMYYPCRSGPAQGRVGCCYASYVYWRKEVYPECDSSVWCALNIHSISANRLDIGTIKHAQLAAITHNREVIARYRAQAHKPGMFFVNPCSLLWHINASRRVQPHTKIHTTSTWRKAHSRLKLCKIDGSSQLLPRCSFAASTSPSFNSQCLRPASQAHHQEPFQNVCWRGLCHSYMSYGCFCTACMYISFSLSCFQYVLSDYWWHCE